MHLPAEEYIKSLIPETAKDYVEEFIDKLAEVNSFADIVKLAKDIKKKRGA